MLEKLRELKQKLIIFTHYPNMIQILRRFVKDLGLACFNIEEGNSIDSILRFNNMDGQAIFLLNLDLNQDENQHLTKFDLSKIQNIVIFDQSTDPDYDILSILKQSQLQITIKITIYRFLVENSIEEIMYRRVQASREVCRALFTNSGEMHS